MDLNHQLAQFNNQPQVWHPPSRSLLRMGPDSGYGKRRVSHPAGSDSLPTQRNPKQVATAIVSTLMSSSGPSGSSGSITSTALLPSSPSTPGSPLTPDGTPAAKANARYQEFQPGVPFSPHTVFGQGVAVRASLRAWGRLLFSVARPAQSCCLDVGLLPS